MARLVALDHEIDGEKRPVDERIARLAEGQHGVVAYRQLVALGLGRGAIEHRLGAGRLRGIHRGVYAVGHAKISRRGQLTAAVLACGPSAVLSHRPAADLWGIRRTSSALIEVSVGRSRHPRPGIRLHVVRRLDASDQTRIDGIPITTAARTLFDLADVLPERQLERAFEEAERLRLFDLAAIEAVCARGRGRRARRRVLALLNALREPPATRSELERLFLDFCRAYGLPEPVFNVVIEGYEVDAWWPGTLIVVELDSFGFNSSRSAFERDREKDLDLKLARFEVIRITDRRIRSDPTALASKLRRMLKAPA